MAAGGAGGQACTLLTEGKTRGGREAGTRVCHSTWLTGLSESWRLALPGPTSGI